MKQTIKLLIILSILNSALSESENLETSDSESAQKLSFQRQLPGYNQPCTSQRCQQGLICYYGKCTCPNGLRYSSTLKTCVDCPAPWMLFKGNCLLPKSSPENLSWDDARSECLKIGADLMDVQPENYFEFMDRYVNSYKINYKFYVGVESIGGGSNYSSLVSGLRVPSDGPIWDCTNLENAYVFCEIGERLANPISDESGCKRCAYVNNENFQLTSIHCDERINSGVQNFICQKRTLYGRFAYTKYVPPSYISQSVYTSNVYCKGDFDCAPGSNCINYYCTCSYGYYLINNKCQKCDIGWIYMDGECFFIQDKLQVSWQEAVNDCLKKNATLLDIDSNNEKFAYPDTLFNFILQIRLEKPLWINGYVDRNGVDSLQWLTTTEEKLETNWPWFESYLVTSLAERTEFVSSTVPLQPFGDLRETFAEIRNKQRTSDNCLTVDDRTELIASYDCAKKFNYVCQKTLGSALSASDLDKISDVLKLSLNND